jgi:hypothetical protein
MERSQLTATLQEMETVRILLQPDGNSLTIENDLPGFSLQIDSRNVEDLQWVFSPFGEECIQLFLLNGSFLIISPNDFVFDVQQEGIIQVQNLPPICSVREMMMGFEDYLKNPCPSSNYDENLGLFYLHLYIIKSAESHGITIQSMMEELIRIGKGNGIWMQENL